MRVVEGRKEDGGGEISSTIQTPEKRLKSHPRAPSIYRHAGNAKNGGSGGDSHFLIFSLSQSPLSPFPHFLGLFAGAWCQNPAHDPLILQK